MRKFEKEAIERGELQITPETLRNEVWKDALDIVRLLKKAGVYGKGHFGRAAKLTPEEEEKGIEILPIKDRIPILWGLLKMIMPQDKATGGFGDLADMSLDEFKDSIAKDGITPSVKRLGDFIAAD